MNFDIYKNSIRTYLVFSSKLDETEVKKAANQHFKVKTAMLVAKKCIVNRDTLYLEGGGHGTKVWAVWVNR